MWKHLNIKCFRAALYSDTEKKIFFSLRIAVDFIYLAFEQIWDRYFLPDIVQINLD